MRHAHPDVLANVNWDRVLAAYANSLNRVSSHDELLDLMQEMQGELGASHAGVSPPDVDVDEEARQGFLGGWFEWDGEDGGWRVVRMLEGAAWDEASAPPLGRACVGARVGSVLLAINQIRLTPMTPPEVALRRLARREVFITLRDPATSGDDRSRGGGRRARRGGPKARVVRVRVAGAPLLRRAIYLDWVARSRACVRAVAARCSDAEGAVGYVHVADMEEGGYEDFTRQYLAEVRSGCRALIVDLRGNAGGATSDLLLARLSQRRAGVELPAHGAASAVPEHAPPSHLIIIIDELTSSDAELLAHELVRMTGALAIGARTWGGVYGVGKTTLIDGTTVAHPEYALRLHGGGRGGAASHIENHGVVPEVAVEVTPLDVARGHDAQLVEAAERAAALAAAAQLAARADDVEEQEGDGRAGGRARIKHWSMR